MTAVSRLPLTILALAPVWLATAAEAALPPYWQRLREMQAILEDNAVHDRLGANEPIVSLANVGDDAYEVRTERCMLRVAVVDAPLAPGAEMVAGPRRFLLEVGEAVCK